MDTRIRLYIDEDAQRTDLVQALSARNIDVLSVSGASLLGQPDVVVRRLLRLIEAKTAQEMCDWLEFLGNWR